jgi:hypothetical protein
MATPSVFDGFDVIEGFDPQDKASLVGVPFGITGVRFRKNDRDVVFAEIEAVDAHGEMISIQDSSSGIRDQLSRYLASQGQKAEVGEAWADIKLFVPRGLRVSTYEVHDVAGKTKQAKTYYLTTEGRRR